MPGNHVKDFRASCDTNLIASDYYIIPEYVLDFKYEKAKYIMKSFAAEKNIYRELPDNKSTVKKEVDLQTKPYLMSAIITASVFLIYVIVFIIIYGVLLPGTITAFWIISLSLLAAAVVLFVVYNKKRSNLTANAIVRGLKIKLDTLEKKLSELKLKPLSNEERERFAAQGQKWQRIK
ncbi:MAG: hypothetical protein LBN25_03715 [Christensenellaceae bacterium]|nr:hypothetical protein [Christensenellaceae bacterium]